MTTPSPISPAGTPGINRVLRTPRLDLRPFTAQDAELLVELDSDPEVMRFLNGGQPIPREYVLNTSVPRVLGHDNPSRGLGFWVATNRTNEEPIGWFHLKPGQYWPDELELGYRLARRAWGAGLATEGSIALRDYTFRTLNAPKLIATTMLGNTASQRVMQKIGMTLEQPFTEERWDGPDKRAVKYSMPSPAAP